MNQSQVDRNVRFNGSFCNDLILLPLFDGSTSSRRSPRLAQRFRLSALLCRRCKRNVRDRSMRRSFGLHRFRKFSLSTALIKVDLRCETVASLYCALNQAAWTVESLAKEKRSRVVVSQRFRPFQLFLTLDTRSSDCR